MSYVVELFISKLDFQEVFRVGKSVLLRQDKASIDIQLFGSRPDTAQTGKILSHIAFISDRPGEDIQMLQDWFSERGYHCETGQYGTNDMALWFDVPGVFLDFVIEVMHTQLLEALNYPPHDR